MKQIEPSLRQDQAIEPNSLDIELKGARWVLRLTVLALSSFLVWAYAFEIDQVVRAPGVIMPSSKVQIIQSKDGGVLLSLPVSAGDEVNKGQVIARFDQTDALADFEDAKARAASLAANMARLEAEIYERQPVFPDEALDYPKFIKSQLSLFERRQASQAEQLAALREILALVKEEIAMNEPLVSYGDVSRTEILRLRRQEAELTAEITNLVNAYFKDAQAEFNETEEELESVKQALLQRERDLRQNTLKSPMRGIVKKYSRHNNRWRHPSRRRCDGDRTN